MSDFGFVLTNSLQPIHPEEVGHALARKRKSLRLSQEQAALKSGISLSMLRRAESQGKIPLHHFLRLADTIGYQIQLQEKSHPSRESLPSIDLNKRYPGLVWSNSKAPKEVFIRKALLNPRFGQLLQLTQDFGIASIQKEWRILCIKSPAETLRVNAEVSRILLNIKRGLTQGS